MNNSATKKGKHYGASLFSILLKNVLFVALSCVRRKDHFILRDPEIE